MSKLMRIARLALSNPKTYQLGLVQAKAFRILKQQTGAALEPYGITTTEWAFLGMLFDQPDGIRAGEAADELGVEAPFVTRLVKSLEGRALIETKSSSEDSRAKVLCLTTAGSAFITEVEPVVRAALRTLARDLSRKDLLGYMGTLEGIVRAGEKP